MTDLHRRVITLAGIGGLAIASAMAHAQMVNLNVKLGLWEGTSTTTMTGMPTIDLDKMNLTPDQRAKMEAAMKMNPLAPGRPPIVRKECITEEKLNTSFFHNEDKNCTRTVVSSSSTVEEIKLQCTGSRALSGDLRIEALSPENVKLTSKMTGTQDGTTMNIEMTTVAKWLGPSCGDVK